MSRGALAYASRAATVAGVLVIAHLALAIAAFAGTPMDGTGELVAATERAVAYKAYALVDALAWMAIGAAFLAVAGLAATAAPARGALLRVAGIGSFVGSLGAFVTYHALPGIAARWAAAGDGAAEAAALATFHDVALLALACFNAGQVAWLVGFVTLASLAATGTLPLAGVARWASTLAAVGLVALVAVTVAHRLDVLMPVVVPTALAISAALVAAGRDLGRAARRSGTAEAAAKDRATRA